jgi:hypothetical protein
VDHRVRNGRVYGVGRHDALKAARFLLDTTQQVWSKWTFGGLCGGEGGACAIVPRRFDSVDPSTLLPLYLSWAEARSMDRMEDSGCYRMLQVHILQEGQSRRCLSNVPKALMMPLMTYSSGKATSEIALFIHPARMLSQGCLDFHNCFVSCWDVRDVD